MQMIDPSRVRSRQRRSQGNVCLAPPLRQMSRLFWVTLTSGSHRGSRVSSSYATCGVHAPFLGFGIAVRVLRVLHVVHVLCLFRRMSSGAKKAPRSTILAG